MKTIVRRTFDAKDHPKGSAERQRLNCDERTSEYQPSYRYLVIDSEADPRHSAPAFRTKKEAELSIQHS